MRKHHDVEIEGEANRHKQYPEKVGITFYPFTDVVNKPVTVSKVLCVAKRDKPIVGDIALGKRI